MQRKMSAQEKMVWTNGLTPPSMNSGNERKLSSPAHLGGISMENLGATENSLYLRHGEAFNGFNMV